MDAETSLMKPTFLFDDRKRYDAGREHDRLRSSLQRSFERPPTADPWKQPPVDFSMKNFHPERKKNRNLSPTNDVPQNEKQLPISRLHDPNVMKPFEITYQNTVQHRLNHDNKHDSFVLDTRVKHDPVQRMLNTDPYNDPQHHDFRQYPNIQELGLSEFATAYERDPFKIRFLSNHLNTIWLQDRAHERIPVVEQPTPEMYRALTARPKWESRLILPKLVYPNKYTAYTRYRNPTRTVQSAYWGRVDDHFEQRKNNKRSVIS